MAKLARLERDNIVGSRQSREVTEQQGINEGKDVNVRFEIGQRRTSEMRAVHVIISACSGTIANGATANTLMAGSRR